MYLVHKNTTNSTDRVQYEMDETVVNKEKADMDEAFLENIQNSSTKDNLENNISADHERKKPHKCLICD